MNSEQMTDLVEQVSIAGNQYMKAPYHNEWRWWVAYVTLLGVLQEELPHPVSREAMHKRFLEKLWRKQ